MRKSLVTCVAALTLSGLVSAPVAAEEVSVSVPYADLNLTSPAGAKALGKRIDAAILDVCQQPNIRDLKATAAWEECRGSARAGAIEQLSILERYEGLPLASMF